MCPNVRSQETCTKLIGGAPLAHPILDVRLTKHMSMTSKIKTLKKFAVSTSIHSFMSVNEWDVLNPNKTGCRPLNK